ncbi:MAG: hypothetical protein ACI8WT_000929 [Clostridium sp.]
MKRASEVNERNESLKQLLKFLKIQELTYDTLLTEVQIPWLLDNHDASEEIKYNILLSIFNVYKAKTVYDSEYLKMLSQLSEVKFLAEEDKRDTLSELLLPKFLRLCSKDSIFESCGYKTLYMPLEIRERIANKLEQFREFLICCGVKVKTEFIVDKINYTNSSRFNLLDEIRCKAWRKRIYKDYTINNNVEIDVVEFESGTKKYLEDQNCDIDKMEELIYSAWVKKFEGNSIDTDTYYYKNNAIPGFFKVTYLRKEIRKLLLREELWAGVKRELIPVRTISGNVIRCNEAFTYKKIKDEIINKLLYKLPVVFVKDNENGQGYQVEYLESLEVRKLSLGDLNQLWKLDQEEYENILSLALDLKNKDLDDVGFMIYDKESKRLRSVLEFKLGTVSSEGSPLIAIQYGEVGEALGKAYKLREESNLDFYKGIFTKVFSEEFKEDKTYQKNFYYLLKSWMHWNSVDRGKIAAELQNTLKQMEYLYEPVVLFNNEELLNTLQQAGVMVVNLVVEKLDNELYELEKAACDLGFILPDESGELVLIDSQDLSEEENYEFKRLLDNYFSILEVEEIPRLKLKFQIFGGIEEVANKIIKVDSAYRILDRNSDVKIPIVLTFLDQKEKRIIAYKNHSIIKLIEDILVILEFTTRRSAHRDLEEIQKQFIAEASEKTVKENKRESTSSKDSLKEVSNVTNDIISALIDERECIASPDIVGWDLGILPEDEESLKDKLSIAVKESLSTGPEIYEKRFRKSSKQNNVNGIELSQNQKLVDRGAVNSKEFLYAEYKGKCQLCGTELDLHNGEKWINVYHIVEKKNGAWWADRPFNILGLCPNCHALTKQGGRRDISNVFVEAKDLLEGNTFAIEVPEFKGDFYVVSVKINGQYKKLKISKLHLLYFSALVELEEEEVEGEIAATDSATLL